jgi:hypothetical protein
MRSVNVFFNTTSAMTVTPISVYPCTAGRSNGGGLVSRKAVGRSIDRILAYCQVADSRLISIFKACRFLGGFLALHYVYRGTHWCSWLRHCTTSRMITCSIPDGVTGISHRLNPFDKTMALGSTQLLTEINARSISWGVKVAGA